MADESAAASMVNYFTTCTAQLRGRAVYVQFSNHKELKTDQTHSNSVSLLLLCCEIFHVILYQVSEAEN